MGLVNEHYFPSWTPLLMILPWVNQSQVQHRYCYDGTTWTQPKSNLIPNSTPTVTTTFHWSSATCLWSNPIPIFNVMITIPVARSNGMLLVTNPKSQPSLKCPRSSLQVPDVSEDRHWTETVNKHLANHYRSYRHSPCSSHHSSSHQLPPLWSNTQSQQHATRIMYWQFRLLMILQVTQSQAQHSDWWSWLE